MHFHAGIHHVWDLELYGRLLETGGGKERMTAYFTVCMPTSLCALAIKTPRAVEANNLSCMRHPKIGVNMQDELTLVQEW